MTSTVPGITVIRCTTKEQISQCYNIRCQQLCIHIMVQIWGIFGRTGVFPRTRSWRVCAQQSSLAAKARYDETALHILALKGSTPIGTARLLHPPTTDKFKLGRLAVRKSGRRKGIAQILVAELDVAAREMGAKAVYAGSQVPVRRLYEKSGYQAIGEEYLDEGQPHIMMVKTLI